MRDKYIQTTFTGKTFTARPVWQYDKGLILKLPAAQVEKFPETFEVHWSNDQHGTASVHIGTAEGVVIPDEYVNSGNTIYGWIYIPNVDGSAVTVYEVTVPVNRRAEPSDYEPTQEEQTVIDQAIAHLNNAIEVTNQNVENSTAAKNSAEEAQLNAENARDLAIEAQTAAEEAQLKSEQAQTKAETAQSKSEEAQAASEEAQNKAETAQAAAERAQGKAEDAQADAENAQRITLNSQRAAEQAQTNSETAQRRSEAAQASAESARDTAISARDAAVNARTDAVNAKNDAETAQLKSEEAQGKAETAQTKSEEAQDRAESARSAAETARDQSETARNRAETAQRLSETAQSKAEFAQTKSEEAQQAAETAQSSAEQDANRAALSAAAALQSEQSAAASANRSVQAETNITATGNQVASDALKIEGTVYGTQNGTAVGQDSEYYQNNAEYFMEACLVATGKYPKIIDEVWYVWNTQSQEWVSTNVRANGIVGPRGVTFTPHVSSEGIISWTNDGDEQNPPAVDITGPQGLTGNSGVYVGTTEPTDPEVDVWLNPEGDGRRFAELDSNGKVPASQLPSYVDDVLEYADLASLPQTGESGKIYVTVDTNKTYRWTGSQYTEISESLAIGETASTAFAGNRGKAVEDAVTDLGSNKADKVTGATSGNFAGLDANGNLVDSGHKHSDYLTEHQTIPVTDVQMDGTSILNDGIANIPAASANNAGVVRIGSNYGIKRLSNTGTRITTAKAEANSIKAGDDQYMVIVPVNQHQSVFYGLAKAAGDITQAQSENTVGTYTEEAKSAIQTMLDVPAKDDIPDIQVAGVSVVNNGVANVPISVYNRFGVVKANSDYGIGVYTGSNGALEGILFIQTPTAAEIKAGSNVYKTNKLSQQHASTFYGLAKAAGDTTQALSDNAVGTYTDEAKSAIQTMLDVPSTNDIPDVPVQDVQINNTSIVNNGIAKIPKAIGDTLGVVKGMAALGTYVDPESGTISVACSSSSNIKAGTNQYRPIVPYNQHESAFYGLAKAAGDTTQSQSSNAVGTYTDEAKAAIQTMLDVPSTSDIPEVPVTDVQINGTSILDNGVAKIPVAGTSGSGILGAVYTNGDYGIMNTASGKLYINYASSSYIKNGNSDYRPIVPSMLKSAVFYGLAKAAGDTTQAASDNTVGNYTTDAKAAIQSMLGIEAGISLVETVSGSTPTITGTPNVRYVCGEVTEIAITPPANGSIDVVFTSGTTPAVLTVPNTVKFPDWFDYTALETSTIYELMITDGVYGAVMTWAS